MFKIPFNCQIWLKWWFNIKIDLLVIVLMGIYKIKQRI